MLYNICGSTCCARRGGLCLQDSAMLRQALRNGARPTDAYAKHLRPHEAEIAVSSASLVPPKQQTWRRVKTCRPVKSIGHIKDARSRISRPQQPPAGQADKSYWIPCYYATRLIKYQERGHPLPPVTSLTIPPHDSFILPLVAPKSGQLDTRIRIVASATPSTKPTLSFIASWPSHSHNRSHSHNHKHKDQNAIKVPSAEFMHSLVCEPCHFPRFEPF